MRSSRDWSLRSTPATIELSDSRFKSHGIRKQKIIATRPSHPLGTQPDPLVEQNSVDSTHTMTNQMLRSFSASNSEGRRRTTIKTQEDFQKWFHAQFPDDKISSSNEEQNQPGAVWLRNHRLAGAKAIRKRTTCTVRLLLGISKLRRWIQPASHKSTQSDAQPAL